MKKIVYFLLFALCLPIGLMAQSTDDDLYFVPSKDKEQKAAPTKKAPKKQVTTNIYTSPGTTVVVKDRKGNARNVDEYNRRYDARENEFSMDNDTLYIKEKSKPDLDGEWVNGEFEGSQDDYDYAERIIRFRNPRFAISISSPLYWDVVYGSNSWDWNIYTDGMYAYAFPTFSNPMWSNWRYGSYGYGWNNGWGWNRPYYGWGYPGYYGWGGGYWGGWYGGGGYWGHHHHYPSYGWGGGGGHNWSNSTYTNRRSYAPNRNGFSTSRRSDFDRSQIRRGTSVPSRTSTSGRTVGSRRESSVRSDSYSRGSSYTRPSSTRSSSSFESTRSNSTRSSSTYSPSTSRRSSSSTYSRGSSTSPSRSSYDSSRSSSSSRSYSPSSSSSSRSSGSSYSSGSSSRSSGGSSSGGGGSSSRGGGSRR